MLVYRYDNIPLRNCLLDIEVIIKQNLIKKEGILSIRTLNYYNKNFYAFSKDTFDVSMMENQDRFSSYIPEGGYILDFGCGSGRDTKYFIEKGFQMDAMDGSEKMCEIAYKNTGQEVKKHLFNELDAINTYDGIWACSSILHLTVDELSDVFRKMIRATKTGGYIYTSFKYGDFEGYRGDRYYTDFTEKRFRDFIKDIDNIQLVEEWISADVRPNRSNERWLNLIIRKPITG